MRMRILIKDLVCICFLFVYNLAFSQTSNLFHHNYSQTLVMKIVNATVRDDGSCNVVCTFEQTLDIIKTIDKLTLGGPKIVYLVGWQYNGHDDKYPAFFEANKNLKRLQDATAVQSLQWLMREAKKYNTTISLHINMTDAYDNSPLWNEYVQKNMISKNADGSLKKIGHYNNYDAYQINYKHEWENGYAQMRIDSLLRVIPELKQSGTIHLDAWIARPSEGDLESNIVEADYQKKVCKYWNEKGLDVTSEFILDYMKGLVPFAYHFYRANQEFYMNTPATVYTGTDFNPDVPSDVGLGFLFGISMNAESIFPGTYNYDDRWYLHSTKAILPQDEWEDSKEKYWTKMFINEFYLHCPQYFFLNKLKRLKVEGCGNERVAYLSNDVSVSLKDSTVIQNGRVLRNKNLMFFPVTWVDNKSYILYSPFEKSVVIDIPDAWRNFGHLRVEEVSENGLKKKATLSLDENQFKIDVEGNKPLLLIPF